MGLEIRKIAVHDNISFRTEVEILNELFGMNYRGFQAGNCPVGRHGDTVVWFPKMAKYRDGKPHPARKGGWINVLLDGDNIRMYTEDNSIENDNFWDVIHITFGKLQDGKYHYLGTHVKRKTPNFPYDAMFECISTELDLKKWDANPPKIEFDDEDDPVEAEAKIPKLCKEQLLRLALQHEKLKPEEVVSEKASKRIKRDPVISKYAKVRAAGFCELCGKPAPFVNKSGEPFLETHHIIPLAESGADTIENTVALCPNCHRKMHLLADPDDVKKLKAVYKCQLT